MSEWLTHADDTVDLDGLGKTLGIADHNILSMLMGKFFESAKSDVQNVVALASGDLAELAKAAHKIKGAAQNLRLAKIGGLAQDIEHQAKAGAQIDYTKLADELEASIERSEKSFKEKYKP